MPTSYSWELDSGGNTGSLPQPGPFVPPLPSFGSDPRKLQFERGIKFANVPGARSDMVNAPASQVQHVNTVSSVLQGSIGEIERDGLYSGAIKYRFRDYRKFPVPKSVSPSETRDVDQFGNPIFPFTGK
jgi:hypothetical protein